ncbi:hypothetical protein Tco_1538045 [Tanacetum coccineum]
MADDDEYTIIYRKPKTITPDLTTEEPDNSLSMGDEHLNTISETEKSSVENLVPIPNISITSPKIDFLPKEFAGELDLINPILPGIDENDFDEEEGEIDNDIFQIEDEILREKLLNLYERFTFDIEPDAPVINNFDELNEDECFDPGGCEIDVSQNIKDDDSFAFVIRTFLPYRTYPVDSPLLLSTGSEDTIFDPGIST